MGLETAARGNQIWKTTKRARLLAGIVQPLRLQVFREDAATEIAKNPTYAKSGIAEAVFLHRAIAGVQACFLYILSSGILLGRTCASGG